jgi:S1-C subfamily serine protease
MFWSIIIFMVLTMAAHGQMQNIDLPNLTTSVMPSVVTIYAMNESGGDRCIGSGFFVSSTDIITCYHVIANHSHIKISSYVPLDVYLSQNSINDNGQFSFLPSPLGIPVFDGIDATVAENDTDHDLARLSINPKVGPPLRMRCKPPRQGEAVFLFGSPDSKVFTVTSGIVSGYRWAYQTRNDISLFPGDTNKNPGLFKNISDFEDNYSKVIKSGFVIQYQAPTTKGNSGGPLVNATGAVIGICDSESTEEFSQNINYAIPSFYLSNVMQKTSIPLCSDKDSLYPY